MELSIKFPFRMPKYLIEMQVMMDREGGKGILISERSG